MVSFCPDNSRANRAGRPAAHPGRLWQKRLVGFRFHRRPVTLNSRSILPPDCTIFLTRLRKGFWHIKTKNT